MPDFRTLSQRLRDEPEIMWMAIDHLRKDVDANTSRIEAVEQKQAAPTHLGHSLMHEEIPTPWGKLSLPVAIAAAALYLIFGKTT